MHNSNSLRCMVYHLLTIKFIVIAYTFIYPALLLQTMIFIMRLYSVNNLALFHDKYILSKLMIFCRLPCVRLLLPYVVIYMMKKNMHVFEQFTHAYTSYDIAANFPRHNYYVDKIHSSLLLMDTFEMQWNSFAFVLYCLIHPQYFFWKYEGIYHVINCILILTRTKIVIVVKKKIIPCFRNYFFKRRYP